MSTPWPLPLVFTAWGFRRSADSWNTPELLALRCVAAGIPTIAVQLGTDDQSGLPWTTKGEVGRLREHGIHVLLWGVAGPDVVRAELDRLLMTDVDWFPQIESPPESSVVFACADAGIRPRGIVTTYSGAGGEDQSMVPRLRDIGVRAVFVECYAAVAAHPYGNLDRMLWQGTRYGWREDELFAVMSTYRDERPSTYTGTDNIGRDFGLYLAEPMSNAQWAAFGALNTDQPKPEPPTPEDNMEPVTDKQALDSHKTASQAAIQNYSSPKPVGRNTIIWRIANADDTSWNKCRDHIKSDLDGAGVPEVPQ